MRDWFETMFGGNALAAQLVVALVLSVLLIAGLAVLFGRRSGGRVSKGPARGRQPRLSVMEAAHVDGTRRLVLVRRDQIEHLVMIGGPTDIVVETNIIRGRPSGQVQPGRRPAAGQRPHAAAAGQATAGKPARSGRQMPAAAVAATSAAAAAAAVMARQGDPSGEHGADVAGSELRAGLATPAMDPGFAPRPVVESRSAESRSNGRDTGEMPPARSEPPSLVEPASQEPASEQTAVGSPVAATSAEAEPPASMPAAESDVVEDVADVPVADEPVDEPVSAVTEDFAAEHEAPDEPASDDDVMASSMSAAGLAAGFAALAAGAASSEQDDPAMAVSDDLPAEPAIEPANVAPLKAVATNAAHEDPFGDLETEFKKAFESSLQDLKSKVHGGADESAAEPQRESVADAEPRQDTDMSSGEPVDTPELRTAALETDDDGEPQSEDRSAAASAEDMSEAANVFAADTVDEERDPFDAPELNEFLPEPETQEQHAEAEVPAADEQPAMSIDLGTEVIALPDAEASESLEPVAVQAEPVAETADPDDNEPVLTDADIPESVIDEPVMAEPVLPEPDLPEPDLPEPDLREPDLREPEAVDVAMDEERSPGGLPAELAFLDTPAFEEAETDSADEMDLPDEFAAAAELPDDDHSADPDDTDQPDHLPLPEAAAAPAPSINPFPTIPENIRQSVLAAANRPVPPELAASLAEGTNKDVAATTLGDLAHRLEKALSDKSRPDIGDQTVTDLQAAPETGGEDIVTDDLMDEISSEQPVAEVVADSESDSFDGEIDDSPIDDSPIDDGAVDDGAVDDRAVIDFAARRREEPEEPADPLEDEMAKLLNDLTSDTSNRTG